MSIMIFFVFLAAVLMLLGLWTYFVWGKDKNHPNDITGWRIVGLVIAGIGGLIVIFTLGGDALLSGIFSPY